MSRFDEQRNRRAFQLVELEHEGFDVKQLTEFQYRINGRLDVYPTWARWHDIKKNIRGSFKDIGIKRFVREKFEEFAKESK